LQIGDGSDTALWARYSNGKLWLLSDDHSTWLGGVQPQVQTTISNAQGSLCCGASSVSGGGTMLQVNWNVTLAAKWAGTNLGIWLYSENTSGLAAGWDRKGSVSVSA
jgi:hypothetical protein